METYLSYASRGKNAWWRYGLTSVPLGVLLMVALWLTHGASTKDIQLSVTPANAVPFFIGSGITFGLILALFVGAARVFQAKRFTDVVGAWTWRQVGFGAAVWSIALVITTLSDVAIQPDGFRLTATASGGVVAAAVIGLGVQTLAEEWIFRGWLTQGLLLLTRWVAGRATLMLRSFPKERVRRRWLIQGTLVVTRQPFIAAILAGLIFGSVHIPNGLPQAVGATAFGIATSLIAIRLGGIAFTWGLHVVNNVFGAVVVVSGGDVFRGSPGVFTQSTPSLMWWDVGAEVAMLAVLLWLVFSRPQATQPV